MHCHRRRYWVGLAVIALGTALGCENKALQNAQTYVAVREYGRAKDILELEIKADPKNVDAYLLLGKIRLLEGSPAAAAEPFDKALILSTKAKGQIAATYLDAAKTLYGLQDRRDGTSWRTIEVCLEKATIYGDDTKGKVSAWALEEASKAVSAEKTVAPIRLLLIAGRIDPGARNDIGTFALKTARAYQEKSFLPEAIAWALTAGEMSPDALKGAAKVIRDAAVLLPLPEGTSAATSGLAKAVQWDSAFEKDDDVQWLRLVRLAGDSARGASQYLVEFPGGKHREDATRLAADAGRSKGEQVRGIAPTGDGLVLEGLETIRLNNAIQVSDRVRGAFDFDGQSSFGVGPTDERLSPPKMLSVCIWIKTTAREGHVIEKNNESRYRREGWVMAVDPPEGRIQWSAGLDSGYPMVMSNKSVADGIWHFVVGVYEPGRLTLYVDGNLEGVTTDGVPQVFAQASRPLNVARRNNGFGPDRYFRGTVGDVRIFDRALTESEIRNMFQ